MLLLIKKFKLWNENWSYDSARLASKVSKSFTTLKTLSATEYEMAETVPGGEEIGCTVTFMDA